MFKNNFDLCVANCEECNGINVERIKEEGIYKCLNTGKTLKVVGSSATTLREYSMVDVYTENEKPLCYTPNNDPYPLCKGNENPLHDCKHCCLYEDMIGLYDND